MTSAGTNKSSRSVAFAVDSAGDERLKAQTQAPSTPNDPGDQAGDESEGDERRQLEPRAESASQDLAEAEGPPPLQPEPVAVPGDDAGAAPVSRARAKAAGIKLAPLQVDSIRMRRGSTGQAEVASTMERRYDMLSSFSCKLHKAASFKAPASAALPEAGIEKDAHEACLDAQASLGTEVMRTLMQVSFHGGLPSRGRSGRVHPLTPGPRSPTPRDAIDPLFGCNSDGTWDPSESQKHVFLRKILGSHYEPSMHSQSTEAPRTGLVAFDPQATFRMRWDMACMFCVQYTLLVLPVRVVWGSNNIGALFFLDLLLDLFFLSDIIVNFNTGCDNGISIDMRREQVVKHYSRTWFLPDLLSSIPYEVVIVATQSNVGVWSRLPRLLKLLRLPRMLRYIARWQYMLPINTALLRIGKLLWVMVVFCHINACIQFQVEELNDFPPGGWVSLQDLENTSPTVQYIHALFRSLSHMLCIGYGVTPPTETIEVVVVMASQAIGASLYVVLVGMLASLIFKLDHSGAEYIDQVETWKDYFRYIQLPRTLQQRVLRYHKVKFPTSKLFEEEKLLNSVSRSLRTDIRMHQTRRLVRQVPLFALCRPIIVRALVEKLNHQVFIPSEVIFRKDELADELYFIAHGTVHIEEESGKFITSIEKGSHFGEFALLSVMTGTVGNRSAAARAVTEVELYALKSHDFKELAGTYPELLEILAYIADARQAVNAGARKATSTNTSMQ